MNGPPDPGGWRRKAMQPLILLLAIAVGGRYVSQALAPLVPPVVGLLVIIGGSWFFFGRRR